MNEITNSILSFFLLIFIVAISIFISSNHNLETFCGEDIKCTLQLIKETNNTLYCDNLINSSQECYFNTAIILNKPNLCSQSYNQSLCIIKSAVANLNSKSCELLNTKNDLCVFQVSIIKNDSSECLFSEKKDFCYYSYAIAKSNVSICNLSEKYKNTCILKIINETN